MVKEIFKKAHDFTKEVPLFSVLTNIFTLFVLYTLCRIVFFLFNIDYFQNTDLDRLLTICIGGVRCDMTAIFYLNSLYMVLALLPFRFRENKTYNTTLKSIYFVTNIIGLLSNCYDTIYFRFINRRTTIRFFSEFQNEDNLLNIALQGCIDYWQITLFAITLIVLLVITYRPLYKCSQPSNNWAYYSINTLLFGVSVFLVLEGIRGTFDPTSGPIGINTATKYAKEALETHIVTNTPFTIIESVQSGTYTSPEYFKDNSELVKYLNTHHYSSKIEEPFKYDNVVIIIVEGLSRDYIGFFNKDLDNGTYRGYTPFLDSLLANSLTFQHSIATSKHSIDAMPSILSGIPLLFESFVSTQYATNEISSLAKYLKNYGYEATMFHGGRNGSMGFDSYATMAGFDKYYGKDEYNNDKDFDGTWAIWDEEFLQYWARTLNTFKEPFLSLVFTASSHHPFAIPEKYMDTFPEGGIPMCKSIEYADYSIRKFFETASKSEWYNNTLFVITADHSSVIYRSEYLNGYGLFSIPILFFHPGDKSLSGVSERVFGQTDITPSILGYLNYDKPYFSFGKDIFNEEDSSNYVVNFYDPLFQIYKDSLLLQYDGDKSVGLYNYMKDKTLQNNLIGGYPTEENLMESTVKAAIQTYVECVSKDSLTIE